MSIMKSGLKQVLNRYAVYNLHYMFNIVDYFIDYKYLEDTLKNLNMMKYLWEQDLIHYVLTSFVQNNWLFDSNIWKIL